LRAAAKQSSWLAREAGLLRRFAPRNDEVGVSSPTSSLPGLTRQSMRGFRSLSFAALFDSWRFSMDHRVKPGGDDGEVARLG
jgi:hypothetical protein